MEVMGYGEGEEEKVVTHWKTKNVEGGTLHKVIIYEDCMSLEVQWSHNDEFNFFKSIELDDPLIKKIGEVVKNFIM